MILKPKNNFDLLQNFIPYKIVKYKDNKYYIMINVFVNDSNIFGYSLYFTIDDKFNPNYQGNEIYEFLSSIDLTNDDIRDFLETGNDSLVIGTDYFLSGDIDDPYIMSANINDYIDLSCIKIKDIDNINYFINKNNIDEFEFSEDELDNLNSTFMKLIQQYSERYNNVIDTIDFVYKNVIDYYANGMFDDATILMNSIFNTQISVSSNSTLCGCNSQSNCATSTTGTNTINTGTDLVPIDTATCIEKYKAAMYEWLIKMLSDTGFYCSWMFMTLVDEDNIQVPNDELLDKLIQLLTDFLNAGYDLSGLKGCTKACGCGHTKKYISNKLTGDCADLLNTGIGVNVDNCSYYSIIENYIKVLNWVKNNEIDENKNKIYIYGKQFAEIFPLLQF